MKDKLRGENPRGGVIVVASDYSGDPGKALNRIRAFAGDAERFAQWRARNGGAR